MFRVLLRGSWRQLHPGMGLSGVLFVGPRAYVQLNAYREEPRISDNHVW